MECGAGKVVLFATAGSAPHRGFKGRRRFREPTPPLKTPVGPSSKELNCPIVFFGPHFRFILFKITFVTQYLTYSVAPRIYLILKPFVNRSSFW